MPSAGKREPEKRSSYLNFEFKKGKILSLRMSQVAHQAGAYPGFCDMKQLGIYRILLHHE